MEWVTFVDMYGILTQLLNQSDVWSAKRQIQMERWTKFWLMLRCVLLHSCSCNPRSLGSVRTNGVTCSCIRSWFKCGSDSTIFRKTCGSLRWPIIAQNWRKLFVNRRRFRIILEAFILLTHLQRGKKPRGAYQWREIKEYSSVIRWQHADH